MAITQYKIVKTERFLNEFDNFIDYLHESGKNSAEIADVLIDVDDIIFTNIARKPFLYTYLH